MKRRALLSVLLAIAACSTRTPGIDCFPDQPIGDVTIAAELAAWSDATVREDHDCGDGNRQCAFSVITTDERIVVFVKRASIEAGKDGSFCTYFIGDHGSYYYTPEGAFERYAAGE